MSVKIRLKRMGALKRPFYRIVVADSRMPRDGRFIETLGYYNPCVEPSELKLDAERIKHWLGRGAQPTDTAGRTCSSVKASWSAKRPRAKHKGRQRQRKLRSRHRGARQQLRRS